MKKVRQVCYFQEFVTRCTVNKISNSECNRKVKMKLVDLNVRICNIFVTVSHTSSVLLLLVKRFLFGLRIKNRFPRGL